MSKSLALLLGDPAMWYTSISGMKDKDSIYQVFRGFEDFMKDRCVCAAKGEGTSEESRAPRSGREGRDEWGAFLEAMKDVRRVERRNERIAGSARERAEALARPRRRKAPTMGELLAEESAFNVVNLPEYMEGYGEGTSPIVIEKLRSGAFSVQKALDLHGLTVRDAFDVFHTFLEETVQSGLRCVKVIHGRGLKSREGPVLKEKLKEWIVRAMHRKWVVAFASCRMAEGGPGATTILLRAYARKKRLHVIG